MAAWKLAASPTGDAGLGQYGARLLILLHHFPIEVPVVGHTPFAELALHPIAAGKAPFKGLFDKSIQLV